MKGPLFPPRDPELVWPSPPDAPRVRWIGAISSTEDLNVRTESFLGIADLFASLEIEAMAGPRAAVVTPDLRWLYAVDPGLHCVHVFDLVEREYRRITEVQGAPLTMPVGICLGPESTLFVCDSARPGVFRLSWAGSEEASVLPIPPALIRPVAAVWDDQSRELFVVDAGAHDIKVLTPGGILTRVLGGRGTGPGEFNFPTAVALRGDTLWVADSANHRIQGITRSGAPVAVFGTVGDAPGYLALPKGIALDSEGHIYVVDARFENVQIFDREGRLLLVFGQEGSGDGEFWIPAGIFADQTDRLWICDPFNQRVQVFQYLRQPLEIQRAQCKAGG